jgi:ABC-type bacteriocin/lantibiotic exporter with double-glycine peptidase domain
MNFLFKFIGARRIAFFLGGLLLLSISDLVGIAIIFPYLKIISEPVLIQSNRSLSLVYSALGFQNNEQFVYALSACMLLFFTLKSGMTFLLTRYQFKGLAELGHRLTTLLFGMLMRARYDYFLKQSPSELVGMNYTYSSQVVFCFQAWLGILNELIFFVLFLGISVYLQPMATMIIFAIMIVVAGLLYLLIIKRIMAYGKEQSRIDGDRYRWTFATVSSIKDAKIMSLGNIFTDRTVALSALTKEISWRNSLASSLPRVSIEYVIMSCFVIVAVLFMRSGIGMEKMIPVLGLMALAALRVLPAFGRLTGFYGSFKYSKIYLDKLAEFHDGLEKNQQDIRHVALPFAKQIEIKGLTFKYGDSVILDTLSMTIKKGQSIGIVGSSGSGKSTLLDVITGLQEKASGRFYLDDVEIDPYDTDALRKYVGYVPQQIAVIDESIAFNIAFSHEYDEQKIHRVIRIANLEEYVGALPDGIRTFVGEAGTRLSGGQKQRLGIARALYRDPEILIFDESTSALDNITEKELSDEIARLAGSKTLIIVAHRLTTIMKCDVIYVLERGNIVAQGSHTELLATCALYQAMNMQSNEDGALEPTDGPA